MTADDADATRSDPPRAPVGMRDLLGPEAAGLVEVVSVFGDLARRSGFSFMLPPVVEERAVFARGVGETADVVRKEMYELTDRGGRALVLRPEFTASVVRAALEHHPHLPWKVWYWGPAFRYERPQAGRYRQFFQAGVEALGTDDPELDVEVVALAWRSLEGCRVGGVRLLVNSLGDPACRPAYEKELVAYLETVAGGLCPEHRARWRENPRRVLDCKTDACRAATEEAPRSIDALCPACEAHFDRVTGGLARLAIPFEIAPRLQRGLDYYRRTTFELVSDRLSPAQNALGGGGRYDGLAEALGGERLAGIGFSLGLERILLARATDSEAEATPDVFVVDLTGGTEGTVLAEELRREGLVVERAYDGRSLKAQMRTADRVGAPVAVLLGAEEVSAGEVTVRSLVGPADQVRAPRAGVSGAVLARLAALGRRSGSGSAPEPAVADRSAPPGDPGASGLPVVDGPPRGLRDQWCGHLGAAMVGRRVRLAGWVARVRDHGAHLRFVDLRDRSGIVQCVLDATALPEAADLRPEHVVALAGEVRSRPEGTANPALATGVVEVAVDHLERLNVALPPPFPVADRVDADETTRLRHRYVDLRRSRLQRNLRLRALVNGALRRAMERQGFVEVETPLLWTPTPEGAREFAVPSRLQPGSFYVLPQSPQIAKQLLMVGGLDRYYQIARCLRDEDLRADRQFEFTQLDVEASFVSQADVLAFVSEAVLDAAEVVTGARPPAIPTMTWRDVMDRFGTDKPDLRFGMEIRDLSTVLATTPASALRGEAVRAITVEGGAGLSRARLDQLTARARELGAGGLGWFRVVETEGRVDLDAPLARHLGAGEAEGIVAAAGARPGDLVLVVAGPLPVARSVLGQLRLELGRPPVTAGPPRYVWVVDFPLFEGPDEEGRPVAAHHPFTMPHPDDLDLLERDPFAVRSQSYDLVLNGWELGSGSIRIHRADIQERIFAVLGIPKAEAEARFGFLTGAFRYGAPPHGGFAVGIDRLVAILAGEENIREVIAYPKTQSGLDPMTGAPKPLDPRQLRELGLRVEVAPAGRGATT